MMLNKFEVLDSITASKIIIEIFEQIWPELVVPDFTRKVEAHMDDVANLKTPYEDMLRGLKQYYIELHQKLITQLPHLQKLLIQSKSSPTLTSSPQGTKKIPQGNGGVCPVCGVGKLLVRYNQKTQNRFFGCSEYPTCRWTSPAKKNRQQIFVPVETIKDLVGSCPTCNGILFLKRRKDFRLVGCSNYPRCSASYFLPKKGRFYLLKERCDTCDRRMISLTNKGKTSSLVSKRVYCVVCSSK